ncbi:MAG: putative manganese transporter [Phycisphaerae bacterium]|jgi:hypothetical protein
MVKIFQTACIISTFVFTMMLLVEYLNAIGGTLWQRILLGSKWKQYIVAALLGALPGCLGNFVVFTMYSHGMISIGAMIAAAVTTFGDEEFVMLAMAPKTALIMGLCLSAIGVISGFIADAIYKKKIKPIACIKGIDINPEHQCSKFSFNQFKQQWQNCTMARFLLTAILITVLILLLVGILGGDAPAWLRNTLMATIAASLIIAATTNDHFLEKHLWHHIALRHLPKIFMWTLGALIVMYFLTERMDLGPTIKNGKWIVLVVACLVGIIPESGPHLIFLTLYVQGTVPLSVLVASSIVQDGHGLLPVLAHSWKDFIIIKTAALITGLTVGAAMMLFGF